MRRSFRWLQFANGDAGFAAGRTPGPSAGCANRHAERAIIDRLLQRDSVIGVLGDKGLGMSTITASAVHLFQPHLLVFGDGRDVDRVDLLSKVPLDRR